MDGATTGILLVQVGTPDAPTAPAVRRYLREFLSDPRVVEMNRILWWFILRLCILPRRPRSSAALYRKIWTDAGSPLLLTTEAQARALEAALGGAAKVEAAMRYGNPSIATALDKLAAGGAERILVLPLFPQYSSATTGSVFDAVAARCRKRRVVPSRRFVRSFHQHPAYIEALTSVAEEEIRRLPWKPERILFSFHGLPKRYIEKGDIYERQVEETVEALARALGLEPAQFRLCYQSRLGRAEWLGPYTMAVLDGLAKEGVKRVAVQCPGFAADCLETIEEIGSEARRRFIEAGGEDLGLIPCLNTHPAWIRALETISREQTAGWM